MASQEVARPRTSVFVGTSVDGFLARNDGTFDFLTGDGAEDGAANGFDAFLATVDAVLMGRNTYEVVLPFPVWPYGSKPVFVLTHRELPPGREDAVVEAIAGTPAAVLDNLAARGLGHVYVDGGLTIQQFLRAGRIDRIVVTQVPVLIGTGISLFGALESDVRLHHVSTRVLPGGAVQSEYRIERLG
ncbi:MAG TPA: dihydrofolate reductase family protein [Candidatus Polarisedimenticolaceae bacterium]|nr:dihydrofolate reductase family protein [Candidatus Polarisedimenticolaceae bacterium]